MMGAHEDAGNVAGHSASSRFAAPSLRCGPPGDPQRPATNKRTAAGSRLPAAPGPAEPGIGSIGGR